MMNYSYFGVILKLSHCCKITLLRHMYKYTYQNDAATKYDRTLIQQTESTLRLRLLSCIGILSYGRSEDISAIQLFTNLTTLVKSNIRNTANMAAIIAVATVPLVRAIGRSSPAQTNFRRALLVSFFSTVKSCINLTNSGTSRSCMKKQTTLLMLMLICYSDFTKQKVRFCIKT